MASGEAKSDWSSRRIALERSSLCANCVGRPLCGDIGTEYQCTDLNVPVRTAHPANPSFLYRLSALGTLEFDVVALPQDYPRLPPFVPIVEPRGVGKLIQEPFVAVSLKDAFHESGSARKCVSLRRRLCANAGSFVLLLCFGKDRLLGRFADSIQHTAAAIATGRFDLVTALGLSYYRADPPIENLINMRESLESFHQLQAHGVPAVPTVSFCNERDVERWTTWLTDNPSVRMVALDFQDARRRRGWSFVLGGFRELARAAPADIHYLIRGASKEDRIQDLFAATSRITVVNAQPFMKATMGVPCSRSQWRKQKTTLFRDWSRHSKRTCRRALRQALQPLTQHCGSV